MWYINRGGITIGPFPAAELKRMATTGQLHPMEWVRKDSATEWIEAHRIQGLFPNAGAPAEHVFFDEKGILVTTVRFVVPNQTFAMSGITSCKFFAEPGVSRLNPTLFLVLGFFSTLVAFAVAGVVLGVSNDIAAIYTGGLVWGAGLVASVIWSTERTKDKYWVTLGSAGGEVRALRDYDEKFIRRIVQSVTDAMIARG